MKIGIVIGTMQGGGAQRVVSVLGHYFSSEGHYVDIITTSDDILDYKLDTTIKFTPLNTHIRIPLVKQVICFLKLNKCLKENRFDVVLSFLPMTCVYVSLCKKIGGRFTLIESERMDPSQDPRSAVLRHLRDWAYTKADGLVMQTEDALHYFSDDIQNKSTIIYNPINENIPGQHKGVKEDLIVTAVRIEQQKNIPMLLDAFRIFHEHYPSYKLELFGKGSQEGYIRQKVSDYGLSESFVLKGFVKDVYKHVQKAKFFVLSSDYEGVSNSMLEALCMGVPVVSTDHPIGGARMFIKDGFNGFLVPIDDAYAFSEAMLKMVKLSNEQYITMCNNAQSLRDQLDTQKVCKEWLNYIMKMKA